MTKDADLSSFSREEVIDTLSEIRHPFDVAVYHSENYFNLGAIVRQFHCMLGTNLYTIECDDMYKKACMGTLKYEKQNIIKCPTVDNFLELTKDRNVIACERRPGMATTDIRGFQYPERPILIFGSEKFGINDRLLERASHVISIPVFGVTNDYNVSAAAGVVMYDWIYKHYVRG